MNTREAAQGQWDKIFSHYGLPPVTGKKHFKGKCPLCGRRGKFRIDDKDGRGTYICVCSAGTGFQLLERSRKKSFRELSDEVDQLLGRVHSRGTYQTEAIVATGTRDRVLNQFNNLSEISGTSAQAYLLSRGISRLPEQYVRFCDKPPAGNDMDIRHCQSLWALATDGKNRVCYLHRTFFTGSAVIRRMTVFQSTSYLEYADSVAIKLFPVAATLGIAEGIETALSCKQIYGVNTWSVMNAGFMGKFVAPRGIEHLIIFADMDNSAAGHAAAFTCARRNLSAGNDVMTVCVRWPDEGDFNDVLHTGGEVRQITFSRQTRRIA